VLALGCAASAQADPTAELALGAHLYPTPYGLTYAYGRIKPPDGVPATAYANQAIALYQSTFPFGAWQQVATLTTDWQGYFSFHEPIGQTVAFRAVWGSLQSKDRIVALPPKVSLAAAVRGRRVTFSGSSYPPQPGRVIRLQRLSRRGRFRTVASASSASGSGWARSLRVRSGGVFRALVPKSGQYGVGVSRPLRVR
jgi:hypothetical protein